LQVTGTLFAAVVFPSPEGSEKNAPLAENKSQFGGRPECRLRPKRAARRVHHGPGLCGLILIATGVALCACLIARAEQESRERYEAQFQLERDPVLKAKILAKLGRFQVDLARADIRADKDEQSLADLEHYRDQVETTVHALSATGVNAEQHPAGFKELQISLRETLRHIDELILQIPLDKRPWFQAVRSDLGKSQNALIEALFPSLGEKRSKRGDP
jgi:hypothetical protein